MVFVAIACCLNSLAIIWMLNIIKKNDAITIPKYIVKNQDKNGVVLGLVQDKLNQLEQKDFDEIYKLHQKGQNLSIIMTADTVEKGSTVVI